MLSNVLSIGMLQKKLPHLLYVNQDSFNVFTPDTCDLLTPEYMEFLIQQDLIS
jgi:hypothetical protein